MLGQRLPVIRIAREAARSNHQALLVRDRHADLPAELMGLASLALTGGIA